MPPLAWLRRAGSLDAGCKRRKGPGHEAEPGCTNGALERRALEDRNRRMDRIRGRGRGDRRSDRHEAHRRRRSARRVRTDGDDPRRRLRLAGGGERPRPERDADREEPDLRGGRRGCRGTRLGDEGRDEDPEPARARQRRADLGRRTLGGRPVRHPRRSGRCGGQDRADRPRSREGQGRQPRRLRGRLRRDDRRRGDHERRRQRSRAGGHAFAAGDARRPRARLRRPRCGRHSVAPCAHCRDRDDGPSGSAEPRLARGRERECRRAADRARGRRRLLAVLREARAGGARRGAQRERRARGRRRDLRESRARLRPDCDHRDGRHVPHRRPDVQLVRDGDDHGGRDRRARLADRPPCPPRAAGRQGRPHARAVPPPRAAGTAAVASGTGRWTAYCGDHCSTLRPRRRSSWPLHCLRSR